MKIGFEKNMSIYMKFRAILRPVTSIILIFVILFISTGRWDYWQGWIFFLLWIYNSLFTWILIPSEVVKERTKINPGTKKWDILIYITIILLSYIIPLIAALDGWKYHWTGNFPLGINVLGLVIVFLGYSLFNICIWKNKFFSGTVRIQKDREHYVIDKGPYAIIRHPGYAGLIIYTLAIGFALNSFWALIPAVLSVIILMIRTYLEDIVLQKELHGYKEYATRVRYRLLPFIW